MTIRISGFFAAAVLAVAVAAPALAQISSGSPNSSALVVAQASQDGEASAGRSRRKKERTSKREPTASQMAARERQKKCSAEWKSAKAAGTVASGMRWPKFWSQCNARLKGNSA